MREAAHAGSGYPADAVELKETFAMLPSKARPTADSRVLAIAAPHVSPFGGVEAYRAAYSSLSPADAERTFVILGTSHYGATGSAGSHPEAVRDALRGDHHRHRVGGSPGRRSRGRRAARGLLPCRGTLH